ncbi:MAG: hypothetical protein JJLCMIEE_03196 [Acidimicrobiales bacterium]|nr:hypothetical protein [Acidimicrobiales bacterium]
MVGGLLEGEEPPGGLVSAEGVREGTHRSLGEQWAVIEPDRERSDRWCRRGPVHRREADHELVWRELGSIAKQIGDVEQLRPMVRPRVSGQFGCGVEHCDEPLGRRPVSIGASVQIEGVVSMGEGLDQVRCLGPSDSVLEHGGQGTERGTPLRSRIEVVDLGTRDLWGAVGPAGPTGQGGEGLGSDPLGVGLAHFEDKLRESRTVARRELVWSRFEEGPRFVLRPSRERRKDSPCSVVIEEATKRPADRYPKVAMDVVVSDDGEKEVKRSEGSVVTEEASSLLLGGDLGRFAPKNGFEWLTALGAGDEACAPGCCIDGDAGPIGPGVGEELLESPSGFVRPRQTSGAASWIGTCWLAR